MYCRLLLILTASLISISTLSAQPIIIPVSEQYDYWASREYTAVIGDTVYVATGRSGLWIVDLSDPSAPRPIGNLDFENLSIVLFVDHQILFTLENDTQATMKLWNIDDPLNPQLLSNIVVEPTFEDETFNPYHVDCWAGTLILSNFYGLVMVDVSDPYNPHETGRISSDWSHNDFSIHNGLLVKTGANGFFRDVLQIYDLSSMELVNEIEFDGSFGNLVTNNNYLYTRFIDDDREESYNLILDISDPTNITEAARFQDGGWRGEVSEMKFGKLNTWLHDTLRQYSLEDPLDPRFIKEMVSYENIYISKFINENLALCASGNAASITMLDVSDWNNPTVLGSYPPEGHVNDVAVSGAYAYVSNFDSGLDVWNITNPAIPRKISHADLDTFLYKILPYQNVLYLSTPHPGLLLADVANPRQPRLIDPSDSVRVSAMSIHRNQLFTNGKSPDWRSHRVRILDVSNPLEPNHIGQMNVDNEPRAFGFKDDILIVADGHFSDWNVEFGNVYSFDISDPTNPREVFRVETSLLFEELVVGGNVVYASWQDEIDGVSDGVNGVNIMRIARGGELEPISEFMVESYIDDIELVEDRLLVSEGRLGISIWDVSDPTSPSKILQHETPGIVQNFVWRNGLLYVADWTNFGIYDCSDVLSIRSTSPFIASDFITLSSYPNPFNSSTTISYSLRRPGRYALDVVDIQGRLVTRLTDEWREAGSYREVLNASDVPSGLLLVKLSSNLESRVQTLQLIK